MTGGRPKQAWRRWAGWVAAGCTAILLVGFPAAAAAHGGVVKSSNPADGAAVANLTSIELRFSTPMLAEYSQFAAHRHHRCHHQCPTDVHP